MNFIEYKFTSDFLYLGERPKRTTFKPCIKTIPFSQISGALNACFGPADYKAVGYLVGDSDCNQVNYMTYSPRDRSRNLSKVPLEVEFLSNVLGKVFILNNPDLTRHLADKIQISLGGLRSRGFGKCLLEKQRVITSYRVDKGILNVRIPLEETKTFDVKNIIKPVYGYLFKPTDPYTGHYVLSLFEGSEVAAPDFLIQRRRIVDRQEPKANQLF